MLTLLDETDRRRIGILEILMQESKWITIGELAQRVGASERTLHSDIAFIKNKWGKQLQLEVSLKNGILLGFHNSANIHAILVDIFKQATAPRFLRELFFHANQPLDYYANRLFISKSTLVRLIPRINAYLAPMNGAVERTDSLYELVCKEEQYLRKLLADAYMELNLNLTHTQRSACEQNVSITSGVIDFSRLRGIVHSILHQQEDSERVSLIVHDHILITQMATFYLISLIRENQGYHVASDRPLRDEISACDLQYVKSLFPAVSKEHLQPIHAQLVQFFLESGTQEQADRFKREVAAFYSRIFDALQVTCPPRILQELEVSLEILCQYAQGCPVYLSGLFRRINGFSSSIRSYHPALYQAFEQSLSLLSDETQINLSPVLPDIITKACFLFPPLLNASPPKRILILSDSGADHAAFIADYLRTLFGGHYYEALDTALLCQENKLDPALLKKYEDFDILVTTDQSIMASNMHKNTILFEDFPSRRIFCCFPVKFTVCKKGARIKPPR